MIGTYYSPFHGVPDSARAEEKDIADFLDGIRAAHPEAGITADAVSCLHFGLLPMDPSSDRFVDPAPAGRPWICDHARRDGVEGLVSVQGVKYTTSRVVAEHTVDLISRKLGDRSHPCLTARTPIFGGDGQESDVPTIVRRDDRRNIPETALRHLARNYGTEYPRILRYAAEHPNHEGTVSGSKEVLPAELIHGIREEMAQSLEDLVLRRTDLGTTGHPGKESLDDCARIAAGEFGWDGPRISRELEAVEKVYAGSLPGIRSA